MRLIVPILAALTMSVPALADHHTSMTAQPSEASRSAMQAALGDARRAEDRARDQFRHPAETLHFFKVEPGMKVGEYAPGGGWYSRLLGLYLAPQGRLTGLFFGTKAFPGADTAKQSIRDAAAKFPADASGWTGVPAERFSGFTLDAVPDAEKGTYDRILIMRMMHNMHRFGMAHAELSAMRALLKDGGLLGIEQHRASADAPYAYADGNKGYMRERDVIALIEAHGFELVARSEINANPKDPANHPDGVWTLPPGFRGVAEADKPRFTAIGESDRMTLLFRKRP